MLILSNLHAGDGLVLCLHFNACWRKIPSCDFTLSGSSLPQDCRRGLLSFFKSAGLYPEVSAFLHLKFIQGLTASTDRFHMILARDASPVPLRSLTKNKNKFYPH